MSWAAICEGKLEKRVIAKAIADREQRRETKSLLRENFSERSRIVQTSGAHYDMFKWISNNSGESARVAGQNRRLVHEDQVSGHTQANDGENHD